MKDWIRSKFVAASFFLYWIILGVGATLTSFQIHATLITIALVMVGNPSLRPPGWNTDTVYGLSRLLWLVVGMGWLGWVMFTFDDLRETKRAKTQRRRFFGLLFILGVIYLVCYAVLLILA
jgi:hypothetical protein